MAFINLAGEDAENTAAGAAATELDAVRSLMPYIEDKWETPASIANLTLSARLAGSTTEVLALLQQANAVQLNQEYNEPPHWFMPLRHCVGTVQLQMGDAPAADQTFRDDLTRNFPDNGWSLYGLVTAMRAQVDRYTDRDIALVQGAFDAAWERADYALDEATLACPMFAGL
uniref:Tetratricopeptide repeat protein n=1 Tax=Florenciella parvula TaxID=236787 RepID=A0A7S2FT71_9STRA|mmetsp:Transcript_21923/g.45673  ORF Transcript_21923/g.45673 Transcript_21923/m.45673 type:complete len:172 (+) Transcript_21923:144-659(+)